MPVPMASTAQSSPSAASQAVAASSSQAPRSIVPFARAGKYQWQQGVSQALAWSATVLGPMQFQVPTQGYLSDILLTINATGGTGAVAVAAADAPWNVISSIVFTDSNGAPLAVLSGYDLYVLNNFGGYRVFRVDASTFGYSAIATSGNFKIKLHIPVEFTRALGVLPNMDAAAMYRININFSPPATVYSTLPTTVPSLNVLLEAKNRALPSAADRNGNPQQTQPPAAGTVEYWTSQVFNLSNGLNTIQSTRVGNIIRNHILIFRDSTGTRALADSGGTTPTSMTLFRDSETKYQMNVDTLRQLSYELHGIDVPAGCVVLNYCDDPDNIAGGEYGDQYLPTVGSTKLVFQFTTTAAGTLEILTNDIVPGSGAIYGAAALEIMGG